jgi:hypothetical protein
MSRWHLFFAEKETAMETTPNLSLPYILPSQAQKHVTHNEALTILDALLRCAVEDMDRTEPPETPSDGQRHVVADAPTGDWAAHAGMVAAWQDGAWRFYQPAAGMLVFDKARTMLLLHDGAGFRAPLLSTEAVGINDTANETTRLAVAAQESRLSHDGAGHRLHLNKASAADTASIIFQDAFSGRAEIGLAGSDRLSFKTSPDGASWAESLTVDPATGNIGVNAEPTERLRVKDGNVRIGWNMISAEEESGGAAMEIMALGTGDRHAYFDFHACDEFGDYSARFIRWAGENSPFGIFNRGLGGIDFICENAGAIRFVTNDQIRSTITPEGRMGIGTQTPTALLQVDGPIRTGRFAKTDLPSASTVGAGSLAWVTDADGGEGLAASNGTGWIMVRDGQIP